MVTREELIEIGAQALLASPWADEVSDPVGRVHHSAAAYDARTVLDAIEPLLRQHILRVVEYLGQQVEYLGQQPQGLPWYVAQGILGTNEAAEAWVNGMEGGSR